MIILEKENSISDVLMDYVESVIFDESFPWFFIKDFSAYEENGKLKSGYYAQPGFHHTCFYNFQPVSSQYDCFSFLPELVMKEMNDDALRFFRMRIGLNYPLVYENRLKNLPYNQPHIDHPADMKEYKQYFALYYVNESDGDTFVFNETEKCDDYTILKRITPQRGKLCIIDGEHYHASSSPIQSNCRVVITMNFLKDI